MTPISGMNRQILIIGAGLMLFAGAVQASAADLGDYRNRLSAAVDSIEALLAADSTQDPATTMSYIRERLPENETIMLGEQRVAVNNKWLHEAISEYEAMPASGDQRSAALGRVRDRLRALVERLKEMEPGAARNQEENKARLAEILRRPDYNKQASQGGALERLWERFLRWLDSLFPERKSGPGRPNPGFMSGLAQLLVLGIFVAAIGFLIWRLAPRYFRGRKKRKKGDRKSVV